MGADLYALRDDVSPFHMGAFSWSWMLNAGVGLPIGCGPSEAGSFVYTPRDADDHDSCPHYNDGFPVSSDEARAMALCAWGLTVVERYKRQAWEARSEQERARIEDLRYSDPARAVVPVRADFVDKAEAFAWWAWASGGFRVC